MNYLKVEQEILKALCKGKKVSYYSTGNSVFVTTDGFVGWMIPREALHLDLQTGAMPRVDLHLERARVSGCELQGTDQYRHGGTARRYLRGGDPSDEVYIDQSLLKCFEAPTFYQGERPTGPITIVEHDLVDGHPFIAGCVMPIRVKDEDNGNEDE